MDLNKSDLLSLLSYLEGELQARDISIAALKVIYDQVSNLQYCITCNPGFAYILIELH